MPVPPDYGEHYLSAACVGSNSIGLPLLPPYGRPRRLLALEPIPGSHVLTVLLIVLGARRWWCPSPQSQLSVQLRHIKRGS